MHLPRASCAVVLEVGTMPPDSFTSGITSLISEALYKIESLFDIIPISVILFLFAY
jgi:hypothetical protein